MRDVTVGIVGLGSIGRAVATLALAFGVARRRHPRRSRSERPAEAGPRGHRPHPAARPAAGAARRERLRGPGAAAHARHGEPDRRADAGPDEARRLAHQRRPRRPRRRARARPRRSATAPWRAPSWTRSGTSRCRRTRRCTALPNLIITPHTSWTSGRVLDRSIELFCDNLAPVRRGRAAAQHRRPDQGVLTALDADRHRRVSPVRARPPSSTRSPAATPRRAASAG